MKILVVVLGCVGLVLCGDAKDKEGETYETEAYDAAETDYDAGAQFVKGPGVGAGGFNDGGHGGSFGKGKVLDGPGPGYGRGEEFVGPPVDTVYGRLAPHHGGAHHAGSHHSPAYFGHGHGFGRGHGGYGQHFFGPQAPPFVSFDDGYGYGHHRPSPFRYPDPHAWRPVVKGPVKTLVVKDVPVEKPLVVEPPVFKNAKPPLVPQYFGGAGSHYGPPAFKPNVPVYKHPAPAVYKDHALPIPKPVYKAPVAPVAPVVKDVVVGHGGHGHGGHGHGGHGHGGHGHGGHGHGGHGHGGHGHGGHGHGGHVNVHGEYGLEHGFGQDVYPAGVVPEQLEEAYSGHAHGHVHKPLLDTPVYKAPPLVHKPLLDTPVYKAPPLVHKPLLDIPVYKSPPLVHNPTPFAVQPSLSYGYSYKLVPTFAYGAAIVDDHAFGPGYAHAHNYGPPGHH